MARTKADASDPTAPARDAKQSGEGRRMGAQVHSSQWKQDDGDGPWRTHVRRAPVQDLAAHLLKDRELRLAKASCECALAHSVLQGRQRRTKNATRAITIVKTKDWPVSRARQEIPRAPSNSAQRMGAVDTLTSGIWS